jgi:TRAF-like zinc-finger/F-box
MGDVLILQCANEHDNMENGTEEGTGSIHSHCASCIRVKCSYKGQEASCAMTVCNQRCGAAFHSCKKSEHVLLCLLEKVRCLNAGIGCPMVLRRCDLARHLPVCPASVVCCTMEWCRWPVYSREREERVPFMLNNLRARSGQLDVALALRDQRVLMEAQKYRPRSVLRTLRNPMTQRYPTVPLFVGGRPQFADNDCQQNSSDIDSDSDASCEDDCEDAPWMTAKKPPGLSESICHELFHGQPASVACCTDTKISAQLMDVLHFEEDVRCALCSGKSASGVGSKTSTNNCTVKHTAPQLNGVLGVATRHADDRVEYFNGNGMSSVFLSDGEDPHSDCQLEEVATSLHEPCLENETHHHMSAVNESAVCDTNTAANVNDAWRSTSAAAASEESQRCNSVNGADDVVPDNTRLNSGSKESSGKGNKCEVSHDERASAVLPPPAPMSLTLNEVLAVDINTEIYARNHCRPKSMYSFMCGQMFRRDAFCRHYENVHSDIHSGLSDWLEHRCPLAHYGCTFSIPRLRPRQNTIVFSPLLESFGLKSLSRPPELDVVNSLQNVSSSDDESATVADDASDEVPSSRVNYSPCRNYKEPTPELFTSKDFDAAVLIAAREASPASCSSVSLTSLPLELTLHIAGFLDSFSLCNFSMTCWYLRNVCQQLVCKRGIVVQEWKRRQLPEPFNGITWTTSKQVCECVNFIILLFLQVTSCVVELQFKSQKLCDDVVVRCVFSFFSC